MTTQGYSVKHLKDTKFAPGLRPYLEYRYLGIKEATEGALLPGIYARFPVCRFQKGPRIGTIRACNSFTCSRAGSISNTKVRAGCVLKRVPVLTSRR